MRLQVVWLGMVVLAAGYSVATGDIGSNGGQDRIVAAETGLLECDGAVGPLLPVVITGQPEPTSAPEVYAAREIVILTADGAIEVAQAKIDAEGNYRIELPEGIYLVGINRSGIDAAKELPAEIRILGWSINRQDVDVDTGIR